MKKILKILTPENVEIEFELAGVGTRFIALVIDLLIQIGLGLVIVISAILLNFDFQNIEDQIQNRNSFVIALCILLIFIITHGYFIFFDIIFNGQSPGKKVAKIKVLKETGEPINFIDSILRNILRLADFLPMFYIAGAIFVIFTKDYKRIGDYAANTIVIKIKDSNILFNDVKNKISENGELEYVNLYPINNFEFGVIREFLDRRGRLGKREKVFEYHIKNYFIKKFMLDEMPFKNLNDFLNEIIRVNSN